MDEKIKSAARAEGIRYLRWWSSDEIRHAKIHTGPRNLAILLDQVNGGTPPAPDTDLGW